MQFSTTIYLLFFLLVYVIYWALNSNMGKKYFLLIASLIFYGSWSTIFLFHFISILLINYLFYRIIISTNRILYLRFAILINILNLGFFKYFYFFKLDNIFSYNIVLPLAISFYTFQLISFQIDCYKKEVEKISLFEFLLFFTFFPQLIAGPILRAKDFIYQLRDNVSPKLNYIILGMFFILTGTTKKILIADNIAKIIDPIWLNPMLYDSSAIFFAFHGFSWQIYCDFSGYSDIAIGSAYLLGYKLPRNFLAPFYSITFQDLWRRWHITLSNWLGDYIYKSLGGNKVSDFVTNRNLFLTFVLGGFWHGASWNYIIWGGFCGTILILEKYTYKKINFNLKIIKILFIVITYFIFVVSLIFFRIENLELIPLYFAKFFYLQSGDLSIDLSSLITFLFFGGIIQSLELINLESYENSKLLLLLIIIGYLFLFVITGVIDGGFKEFIYFQF